MLDNFFENNKLRLLLGILLVVLIIWLTMQISYTLFPMIAVFAGRISSFILGIIFAFLLNPFVEEFSTRFLQGKKSIAVILTVIVIVAVIAFLIVPIINDFVVNFSGIIAYLSGSTASVLDRFDTIGTELRTQILNSVSSVGRFVSENLLNSVNNIASASMNTFLTIIVTVFTLLDYDNLVAKIINLFKPNQQVVVADYIYQLETKMYDYLKALLFSFLVCSLVFGVVLQLLLINNAWSIAMILSLLIVLIPIIGPFIATIILIIITLPVSTEAIIFGFCGLFIFMQVFINIISPRIYARTLTLPNLLIILSFMIGNALFGIVGALFAIPGLIIVLHTYRFIIAHKEKAKGVEEKVINDI